MKVLEVEIEILETITRNHTTSDDNKKINKLKITLDMKIS